MLIENFDLVFDTGLHDQRKLLPSFRWKTDRAIGPLDEMLSI